MSCRRGGGPAERRCGATSACIGTGWSCWTGSPLDYQGQRSPFPPTPEAVQKGGALYLAECASCHGRRGLGDGDAGKGLSPSPALIAFLQKRPMAVDAYLMWSIAEGGKPLGSDMPAFKNALTETEIWQIVAFMRAGFPPLSKIGGGKKIRAGHIDPPLWLILPGRPSIW